MAEYNMYEAKTNLSKICRLLEEKKGRYDHHQQKRETRSEGDII
ncbi:MAG: hypothetical protein Q4D24_07630 [Erysipelotrichaceae bacterium]|nr:hypothetical protein [Erysipelotrichaceae bacterium]